MLSTGLGADWPSPHRLVCLTMSHSSSSCSQVGAASPSPSAIRVSRRCICTVPARQGMHLPHDSSMQNSMKKRATSTMLVVWSMTIMPPEPMIEPSCASDS